MAKCNSKATHPNRRRLDDKVIEEGRYSLLPRTYHGYRATYVCLDCGTHFDVFEKHVDNLQSEFAKNISDSKIKDLKNTNRDLIDSWSDLKRRSLIARIFNWDK